MPKRYGGSLYELAAEENLTDRAVGGSCDAALDCIEARSLPYLRLLSTPGVPEERSAARLLDKAFAGAHPYLVNFLKLLCEEDLLGRAAGLCARVPVTATMLTTISLRSRQYRPLR